MRFEKGQIVDKSDFIDKNGFAKEYYEGLLVASDEAINGFHVGIQLSEDKVLVVDQAGPEDARTVAEHWAPRIDAIQREYGVKRDPGVHITGLSTRNPQQ